MHIHVRVLVLYYVVVFGTEKPRQADQRDDKRFIIPKKRMERKSTPEDFRTETCKKGFGSLLLEHICSIEIANG